LQIFHKPVISILSKARNQGLREDKVLTNVTRYVTLLAKQQRCGTKMWVIRGKVWMTVSEIAEMLGVTRQTVYRWIREYGMPASVSKGKYLIPYAQARIWLRRKGYELPTQTQILRELGERR